MNTTSLAIPIPAVQGQFGDRVRTYVTQVAALDLVRVLEHDPRPQQHKHLLEVKEMYDEIQRALTPARRNSVSTYVESRLQRNQIAGFPAISIGATEAPRFTPYNADEPGAGTLRLSGLGSKALLDGLGRAGGTLDIKDHPGGLDYLKKISFPVTFFAPAEGHSFTVQELAILFADFNYRVNPVPPRLAMLHDVSDLYIAMTREIANAHFIADFGGMEYRAASLGKKSTAIVVQQTMVRVVRGAIEGRAAQESNVEYVPNAKLTDSSFRSELTALATFFNGIADEMGARWRDRSSMHLSSPAWQAMGLICYDVNHGGLSLTPSELSKVQSEIARFDWSRENLANLGLITSNSAGRSNKAAVYDHLRKITDVEEIAKMRQPQPTDSIIARILTENLSQPAASSA